MTTDVDAIDEWRFEIDARMRRHVIEDGWCPGLVEQDIEHRRIRAQRAQSPEMQELAERLMLLTRLQPLGGRADLIR